MTASRSSPDDPFEPALHLAHERMAGLHREAQVAHVLAPAKAGLVTRLRNRVGVALIALGRALAAPDRPLVNRPARRP